MENIGLQDSLLSRFDLLFVMLDVIDSDQDHIISDHVVRMHRYRSPLEQDGEALSLGSKLDMLTTKNPDDVATEESQSQVYQKYDPLLHGQTRSKKYIATHISYHNIFYYFESMSFDSTDLKQYQALNKDFIRRNFSLFLSQ